MAAPAAISVVALAAVPEVRAGDDLAALIVGALAASALEPRVGDLFVLAQKIVSKSEDRWVDLGTVKPSARAQELARITSKDPRFVEVVLGESCEVVRAARNVLITRHRLGYVMANAGIDRSNIGERSSTDRVLLLPRDPDASARALREALERRLGGRLGVIISDSFGRPWRRGVVNVALGVAGPEAVRDLRGTPDRSGRRLESTDVAFADALAAAAGLAMGEAGESKPVVLVRGLDWTPSESSGQTLLRSLDEDLFR